MHEQRRLDCLLSLHGVPTSRLLVVKLLVVHALGDDVRSGVEVSGRIRRGKPATQNGVHTRSTANIGQIGRSAHALLVHEHGCEPCAAVAAALLDVA